MRTDGCFRKEHNTVEIGKKEENKWESDFEELGHREEDVFIISDDSVQKKEKHVRKFEMLENFPPIITYHII